MNRYKIRRLDGLDCEYGEFETEQEAMQCMAEECLYKDDYEIVDVEIEDFEDFI